VAKIVFEGDSITLGQGVTTAQRFSGLAATAYPQHTISNVAHGGDSLDYGAGTGGRGYGMHYQFASQVLALNPDVIVLMSGTNDIYDGYAGSYPEGMAFRIDQSIAELEDIIAWASGHVNPGGGRPALIVMTSPRAQDPSETPTTGSPWIYDRVRADLENLVGRQRARIAEIGGAYLVDQYQAWTDLNDTHGGGTWFVTNRTQDGVHPTVSGHQDIYNTLAPTLATALANGPLARPVWSAGWEIGLTGVVGYPARIRPDLIPLVVSEKAVLGIFTDAGCSRQDTSLAGLVPGQVNWVQRWVKVNAEPEETIRLYVDDGRITFAETVGGAGVTELSAPDRGTQAIPFWLRIDLTTDGSLARATLEATAAEAWV
jgi:lysophospholipase L1-like esterase